MGGKGELLTSRHAGDVKNWLRLLGPLEQKSDPKLQATSLNHSTPGEFLCHSTNYCAFQLLETALNTDGCALPAGMHILLERTEQCVHQKSE